MNSENLLPACSKANIKLNSPWMSFLFHAYCLHISGLCLSSDIPNTTCLGNWISSNPHLATAGRHLLSWVH